MPTLVTFNGINYNIPLSGETGWGDQANQFLVAVATAALTANSTPTAFTIGSLTSTLDILSRLVVVPTAGYTITPTNSNIYLNPSSAVLLSTTTAISNGVEGQILMLSGSSDTNTVTIQDAANTSLNGDVILGLGDSIELKYSATTGWTEQRRSK